MFTAWYKIIGESEVEMPKVIYCGIQPDYVGVAVYFLRDADGIQIEIPLSSLAYVRFSKERYQQE